MTPHDASFDISALRAQNRLFIPKVPSCTVMVSCAEGVKKKPKKKKATPKRRNAQPRKRRVVPTCRECGQPTDGVVLHGGAEFCVFCGACASADRPPLVWERHWQPFPVTSRDSEPKTQVALTTTGTLPGSADDGVSTVVDANHLNHHTLRGAGTNDLPHPGDGYARGFSDVRHGAQTRGATWAI